jgi:hypothetical protein
MEAVPPLPPKSRGRPPARRPTGASSGLSDSEILYTALRCSSTPKLDNTWRSTPMEWLGGLPMTTTSTVNRQIFCFSLFKMLF